LGSVRRPFPSFQQGALLRGGDEHT
jgi:hypothetical protein